VYQRRELLGGKGANQAVALAQLGMRPALAGVVGEDQIGHPGGRPALTPKAVQDQLTSADQARPGTRRVARGLAGASAASDADPGPGGGVAVREHPRFHRQ